MLTPNLQILVVKINTINPQPLKKGGMEQVIL
jgi:hypothetical protein